MHWKSIPLLAALLLAACSEPPTPSPAQEARILADTSAYLDATYGLKLQASGARVRNSCIVWNSQCELSVWVDGKPFGLPTNFVVWPRYSTGADQAMTLVAIEDDLRGNLIRAPLLAYFAERVQRPDAPRVALRMDEFNGFVAIKDRLPSDLPALRKLDAPTLLDGYGKDVGITLWIYVYADPASFEPRAKAMVERLLADPALRRLGNGYDLWFYFRKDALPAGADAASFLENQPGHTQPLSTPDNTRARWRLRIGGANFGQDLDQPVESIWKSLERVEPFPG
jgi:hypothetical protein